MNKIFSRLKTVTCFAFVILQLNVKAQNYDEAKVRAYTLPAALKTAGNKTITTAKDWEQTRRKEILQLFEDNVYGEMPKNYDSILFSITNTDASAMAGRATLREVDITVWNAGKQVKIDLILFTPNAKKRPPVFLLINNRGKENTDVTRVAKSEFWPAEMMIDSGYAIATFHVSDAAPDDTVKYVNGVLQLYPEQLQKGNGMKAIGAWSWAASRVMDYFEQAKEIDAKRVGVVGHSRGGKAALWAGAQDQRFAFVVSNCSGNTGAALSRRKYGETIQIINTRFPHWFCNNYKKYNDNEAALPVDQHMLLSLIAPRPVYVTSASKDLWADPRGSYLSLLEAQKVYALYQKNLALAPEPPSINTPVKNEVLGYHNREGKHDLTAYDWSNFAAFATSYYIKSKLHF